jgi:hypothetical protein
MRQSRLSGSVEGVMGNHDSYSDFQQFCRNVSVFASYLPRANLLI